MTLIDIDTENVTVVTGETFADNYNVTRWTMSHDPRDMSWIGWAEIHNTQDSYHATTDEYAIWLIESASWGDYSNAGIENRSNHRSLLRDYPEHLIEVGLSSHDGQSLALIIGPAVPDELIGAIHHFDEWHIYDEDDESALTDELATEAWEEYQRHDIVQTLTGGGSEFIDEHIDGLNEEWLKNRFYAAYSTGKYDYPYAETATSIVFPQYDKVIAEIQDDVNTYCAALIMDAEREAWAYELTPCTGQLRLPVEALMMIGPAREMASDLR